MKTAVTVTEEEARGIALVRALEEHGGAVPMLDATQRAAAGNVVWKSIGPTAAGLSDADWVQRFLLPRTQRLLDEAASAQPVVRRLRDTAVLRLVAVAALGLAALGAFAADRLAQPHHVNLMALPFMGFVLWNWAVYLMLALRPLWDLPGRVMSRLLAAAEAIRSQWTARGGADAGHAAVAKAYFGYWSGWAWGTWRARLSAWLHASSLAIATGLLLSLAWAAWHSEFQVGWASTLCPAGCVHAVHSALTLPVAGLADVIGAEPFSAAEIALRHGWRDGAPDDGMRWFRLTMALLMLTVVLPRLLLLGWALATVKRRRVRVPLPLHDAYFMDLRQPPAELLAAPETARVAPTPAGWNARVRGWWDRVKGAGRGRKSPPDASPGA